MRRDTEFTLLNMPSETQNVHASFCYKTNTAFTLQNILSENQDLCLIFCYETRHCLFFGKYAL